MTTPPIMIWALVPQSDVHAVRRALRQHGWAFTTQKARGGLWHVPHQVFWLIVSADTVAEAERLIHEASPPRTVRYHSPHGWHADAWLHPATVDLQGAVIATWAVTVSASTHWPLPYPYLVPEPLAALHSSERRNG